MQNILAKLGDLFEAHVEKIVLAVAGIIGLWLLMVFVVMNPNVVTYDDMSFSPGSIDEHIYTKKAKIVRDQLAQSANAADNAYQSILSEPLDVNAPVLEDFTRPLPHGFEGLFACSISNIDSHIVTAVPAYRSGRKSDERQYALPYVGRVSQVLAEHIRAAAYKPSEPITAEQTYQSVTHEVNDVDLVTVQARFDVASLRARFFESFAGGSLPPAWQDQAMGKPVFAAVDLQRQARQPDGTWGPWEEVPRIDTLPQNETYAVIEKASDLPAGGVRVRMIRLNEETVRTNILQPPAYEIASTYEEWLPPELHGKYQIERQKEELQKRREEREAEKSTQQDTGNSRSRARGGARGGVNTQQGTGRNLGGGAYGPDSGARRGSRRGSGAAGNDRNAMMPGRTGAPNDRNTRRNARGATRGAQDLYGMGDLGRGGMLTQASPLDEVFDDFEEIRLSPLNEFFRLDEVVFWAHDDSAEPGKTYQYRIRLGVLNPVAGLGQVVQKDIAFKDQVILWSDFSEVTKPVEIPNRLYFFATQFQDVSNSVSVEVAKFDKGYWRSEIFSVKPGEAIGRLVEIEPEENADELLAGSRQMYVGMLAPEPDMVDFSTGVVFVAAEKINKWVGGKNLRAQVSFDMLYSDDGMEIQHLAIGSKNWPESLSLAYGNIKKLQKEPIEEYRAFGSSRASSNAMGMGGGRGAMGMGRDPYGR
ncbi:MAG: hypothetical protein K9N55_03565 [Phycisphaerae bacterium]|nr:hypothetical protein [Phycisphaerae bacterium]